MKALITLNLPSIGLSYRVRTERLSQDALNNLTRYLPFLMCWDGFLKELIVQEMTLEELKSWASLYALEVQGVDPYIEKLQRIIRDLPPYSEGLTQRPSLTAVK